MAAARAPETATARKNASEAALKTRPAVRLHLRANPARRTAKKCMNRFSVPIGTPEVEARGPVCGLGSSTPNSFSKIISAACRQYREADFAGERQRPSLTVRTIRRASRQRRSRGADVLRREHGDPGKIRTSDTQFRKLLLYPPELRGLLSQQLTNSIVQSIVHEHFSSRPLPFSFHHNRFRSQLLH